MSRHPKAKGVREWAEQEGLIQANPRDEIRLVAAMKLAQGDAVAAKFLYALASGAVYGVVDGMAEEVHFRNRK